MMRRPEDESGTTPPVSINYTDAEHYLETLIGPEWDTAVLVFQTYDDNRDRRRKQAELAKLSGKKKPADPYAKIQLGTWAKCKDALTTINNNGGAVSLTINQTDKGRTAAKVTGIRAVWCEWDTPTAPPEWPIAPHIIVESSPNKFHFYWRCTDLSTNDHHRIMQAMVGKWGSDPDAADVVRALRVPGFIHRKIDSIKGLPGTPWQVRLVSAEAEYALPPYSLGALLRAFEVNAFEAEQQTKHSSPKEPSGSSRAATPINVVEVREALTFIAPDERNVWLKIGMALASTHHASAFQLWDEWSRKSDKYDEDDQYRVWQSFREHKSGSNEGGVTLGTLYKMAKAAGWDRNAGWVKNLLTTQKGDIIDCPANIALILRHSEIWAGQIRFNSFTGNAEYGEPVSDEYGRSAGAIAWSDTDDARLADFLLREYRMPVKHLGHCTQAVDNVARDYTYDPITKWLDELPSWDGEWRLDNFFSDYCGAPLTPYTAFCGRSFFISLVARAYQPGCQVDTVLVLEGAEGARKTSLCRLLGGPWYKAINISFENSKELYVALRHAWVAELAELDAFARAGQARIKSLLTTLKDNYRPPYGRHEITQPRRTVFIGTTNDPQYIVDPFGGRRFFPLKVKDIQIESIVSILPQLFAEARDRLQAGELWWTDDQSVTQEANEVREQVRESDPWEDLIRSHIEKYPGDILMNDVFGSLCLDIPAERRTRAMQTRVGIILKTFGYTRKRRRAENDWKTLEYYYTQDEN